MEHNLKNKPAFKIALVGTACVGKTTIMELLRQKYEKSPAHGFVEEYARFFFESHPEITDRFSQSVQEEILELILYRENEVIKTNPSFILCDRSIIDPVVYVGILGEKKLADILLRKAAPWIASYGKIFLLDPADVPYKTDTIRNEDETTRLKLHQGFVEFFEKSAIPYELLGGTLQERINKVEKILAE
jgi:nicotinamide riboside kinase